MTKRQWWIIAAVVCIPIAVVLGAIMLGWVVANVAH